MKNIFRKIVAGYIILFFTIIMVVCVVLWKKLDHFQKDYDAKKTLLNQQTQNETEEIKKEKYKPFEIIAYSNMQILVDGKPATVEVEEEMNNQLLDDYSNLTGNTLKQCRYMVMADSLESITVKDVNGKLMEAEENDYTNSSFEDDELSKEAVHLLEQYLRFINEMISLEQLQNYIRSTSPVYQAVKESRESLKWIVAAKEITFPREEINFMQMLDEDHMICELDVDLHKVTINQYVVNESVKYRILFERVDGQWYLYSFVTLI